MKKTLRTVFALLLAITLVLLTIPFGLATVAAAPIQLGGREVMLGNTVLDTDFTSNNYSALPNGWSTALGAGFNAWNGNQKLSTSVSSNGLQMSSYNADGMVFLPVINPDNYVFEVHLTVTDGGGSFGILDNIPADITNGAVRMVEYMSGTYRYFNAYASGGTTAVTPNLRDIGLSAPTHNTPTKLSVYSVDGMEYFFIDDVLAAEFRKTNYTQGADFRTGLYVCNTGIKVSRVTVKELLADSEESDGTVEIYNGDTLAETLEGLEAGDAFPAITIPEAPDGQYFAGLSLDPAGNNMLTSKTFETGISKLYYVFKDYEDSINDNTFTTNTGGAIYPTNYNGHFYPTFAHRGWSAKGVTDGTFRFYAYNTWYEAGITYATDTNGFAVALKPYSKYTITVTYRSVTLANELRFKIGYGLTPNLVTDLANKGFSFNTEEITLKEPVNDWTTMSFEFETGSLNGIIPVAGVYANCAGLVNGVRSELQIQSINIERLPIDYGISHFEYNGGFKDYNMTDAPVGEQFIIGEEPLLPKTAYRYRYAFGGWFYDEDFTQPAGERYENGKTYYAKWVLYGDMNEDGFRNLVDLVIMKKHISGMKECNSAAADVTDDHIINAADLTALGKKLLGFNSILGPTRYIALTFDDGPNQYFENIVHSFNTIGGKATFFVIADSGHLNDNTKPYLQYAIDQDFEIGNHSINHANMQTWTDKQAVKNQMQSAWQRVYDMVGYDMKVARLPNFGINDIVIEAMNEMNLPMFGNAFVTGELDTSKTAEEEKQIILDHAFDGAVVCLHAMDKTVSILDDLLAELREDGYEFVTASDLFQVKGYDTIPLGVQHQRVDVMFGNVWKCLEMF